MKRFGEPVIDTPQQHIQQNWYTLAAKQTQNHWFGCTTPRFTENGVKRPKESRFGIIKATPEGASTSEVHT